jgi:glycerol uptake facilitator-like aquaporin
MLIGNIARRLVAEAIGTAFLLATVVGSGIMGETLSGGNVALALLGNTLATGAILVVLILAFGPISGAHFNPAVTVAFLIRGEIGAALAVAYIVVQVASAMLGTVAAHFMFEEALIQFSAKSRTGPAQWFSEALATFGLLMTILATLRWRPNMVPYAVGLFISAGYWFTASTSFANPAVTVARSFTDTFSGIDPLHVPGFIAAQFVGALLATGVITWLLRSPSAGSSPN